MKLLWNFEHYENLKWQTQYEKFDKGVFGATDHKSVIKFSKLRKY